MRLRLAGLLAALLFAAPAAAERIRSFETDLFVDGSASFVVEERIQYDFEGEKRRGIFRLIPVRYGRGAAADYRIRVDVESVTDASGNAHPYRLSSRGPLLEIRIGDPDVTLSGVQDYRIRYRVTRGFLYFEERDELYWNPTGTEWEVPIDRAVSTVYLPEGVDASSLQTGCFTGAQGSVERACTARPFGAAIGFASDRPLSRREGLTIVVALPKGLVVEPSAIAQLWSRVSDYLSAWALLPLLVVGGMGALWRSRGRDPGADDSIPVRYEPPEGLTPAEVGTVFDERADLLDVTSTILDLAVRGHVRIEEQERTKYLFLSDTDVRLHRLSEPADPKPHEALLIDRLFRGRDSVLVSDLKNKFYKDLPGIREAIYRQVSRGDGFFPTNPDKVRQGWRFGALVLAVGAFFAMAAGGLAAAIPVGLCAAIVFGFAGAMPRRTRRGTRACKEILGFKEFVERVDKDRLERMGARSIESFEHILPFAIVLGVADSWADAFDDIYTEPPDWYQSPRYRGGRFLPHDFVVDLGRSLSTVGETMVSAPKQSGSGSSGFGGGGFSGGGFGGGGGGSW